MNQDDLTKLLNQYTEWQDKHGLLKFVEIIPPRIVEEYLKDQKPEIKPEVHIALLCPHVAQDTTLVRYAFPLGDHSLRVCRACYDSIQGNILEDVVKDSLKTMFGTWMMKDHKPFIG